MSTISLSTVGSNTLSFVDVARLVGLTDDELSTLKSAGIEVETDLALLKVQEFRQILNGSTERDSIAMKLHTLGRYIAKGCSISQSTTMEQVNLCLEGVNDRSTK
jgi:hypothetical protein